MVGVVGVGGGTTVDVGDVGQFTIAGLRGCTGVVGVVCVVFVGGGAVRTRFAEDSVVFVVGGGAVSCGVTVVGDTAQEVVSAQLWCLS